MKIARRTTHAYSGLLAVECVSSHCNLDELLMRVQYTTTILVTLRLWCLDISSPAASGGAGGSQRVLVIGEQHIILCYGFVNTISYIKAVRQVEVL